jgi:hypothetical protein
MSTHELDALIIEHLVDLDRAGKRIATIEHRVFSAMNARAEEWAKRHGWKGKFEISENGGWNEWVFWIFPSEWGKAGDESGADSDFYFAPNVGAGDTENGKAGEPWNYVTRLCGLEGGQIGFRFGRPNTIKKRQWQGIVDRFRDDTSSVKFMVDSEPSFFLGFRIDPVVLAAALRDDDPNAALDPFAAALDTLLEARPVFDKLVEHLRAASS